MSDIKITGNTDPIVGKQELYTINCVLGNVMQQNLLTPKKSDNPFENMTKWSVHVLENGKWRKTEGNDKEGETAPYTFNQRSLDKKGIKLVVERGNEHASIIIIPQKAEVAEITKVEILDVRGKTPTKPFAYGQTLIARTHCVHMELRPITVTLWEDDATGAGHNAINNKNKIQTKTNSVFKGIVDIPFLLTPDAAKIANAIKAKGDSSEGKTHEYYVTAEIYAKEPKKIASANVMANNPDYKTESKPPSKPAPAEKKGKSKKEEKGIGETIIDSIHDWWEETVNISPIISPSPIDFVNSVMKIFQPDDDDEKKKEEKKGTCERCKVLSAEEMTKVFTGASQEDKDKLRKAFNEANTKLGLDTCQQKAHFFAQVLQEIGVSINVSDGENLNYKVDDLPNHFKRFSITNRLRGAPNTLAYQYGRRDLHRNNDGLIQKANKEMIANIAYANREGNGDFASGDGWKYRGRGIIQITFKDKYSKINNRIISDFPEFGIYIDANNINNLHEGTIASMAYWKEYGCQKVAKKGFSRTQLDAIVDIVNSSTPSRNNRWTNLQNCIDIFKVNQCKK